MGQNERVSGLAGPCEGVCLCAFYLALLEPYVRMQGWVCDRDTKTQTKKLRGQK